MPILGEVLHDADIDMAYTGKWHIEGSGLYLGDGRADGGFPDEWWYDGRNYADDIGPEREAIWRRFNRGTWKEILESVFISLEGRNKSSEFYRLVVTLAN